MRSASPCSCWRTVEEGQQKRRSRSSAAASLLLTPILWPNYLVIMLVPLALLRPRFGVVWLLPVILFGQPVIDPPVWEIAVLLGILAALTLLAHGDLPRQASAAGACMRCR